MAHPLNPVPDGAARRRNALGAACLWCLFIIFCSVPAARAQYRFDSWTADTGLPQNIIRALHQTPDGYLWLATLDGLVRFDGVRFTVFNKMNSPGINSNRFISLYEDRGGALWLGTENGGVTRYRQGEFTTYTTQDGLANNLVLGICGDAEGNVLILSGETVMRWADGQFLSVATIPVSNDLGTGVTVIERGNKGGFWGVNDLGLSRFADGRLSVWTRKDGLPSLNIQSVAEDRQGNLWVATRDAGLVKIESGRVVKVLTVDDGLPSNQVRFIYGPEIKAFSIDRKGALWMTELDSGRNHLLMRQPPNPPATPSHHRLYEDRESNIWIGTEGGGLYRMRKQAITVYSKQEGLAGRSTYPVYEDRAGNIWIGADGLNRFADGTFDYFKSGDGLPSSQLTAIGEDRDGRLWIGTVGGPYIFSGGRLRLAQELSHVLPASNLVQAICQDREGALWFGARNGLVRYQNETTTQFTTRDGLAGDDTKVIIEGRGGRLWIGSYSGLTQFKDGNFTVYTERDGLPSNSVRALYEDQDGVLWIGTYDGGLGRLKDGKFTRYTTRDGLFNDGVFQILEDGHGWFWMSCNRGIYRVSKRELNDFAAGTRRVITSIAYGKSDGMRNAECNGGRWPAGVRARDGRLWFPTQDGAAVIDPATITSNPQPPPVLIESVLVDREPAAFNAPVAAVVIEPGRESFEIVYTALSFINSEHLRFKYRLEGLDQDWTEAGTRRSVYYSHIPPGEYTFRVIAANSDGVWNEEGRSLRIVVLPPFYRTWWFLMLIGLVAAGVVWVGYEYRVRRLRRARDAQQAFARQLIESQEQERKRIAAELHDSLGQNLLIIKNRALLGQLSAEAEPQFREQFEQVVTSAGQAIEEVREIAQNLRPYHLDRLGLSEALEAMIVKVADSTTMRFVPELIPLDGLFSKEAAITLYRVVQESLNNVIKHAQASEARITIERQSDLVVITIRDNGRGFAPKTAGAKPGGFGLAGMAERVSMLGGELGIQSAPGQGTTVTIRLSLPGSSPQGRHHGA